jgi:hypothetical protein
VCERALDLVGDVRADPLRGGDAVGLHGRLLPSERSHRDHRCAAEIRVEQPALDADVVGRHEIEPDAVDDVGVHGHVRVQPQGGFG